MSVGCTYQMVAMWGKEFIISADSILSNPNVSSLRVIYCNEGYIRVHNHLFAISSWRLWKMGNIICEWWLLSCPFLVQSFAIERGPKFTLHCNWVYNSFLVCWNTWFITVYVIHFVANFGVLETALKNSISSTKVEMSMAYINVPFPIRGFMKFKMSR